MVFYISLGVLRVSAVKDPNLSYFSDRDVFEQNSLNS
jgi:hypothetical protein